MPRMQYAVFIVVYTIRIIMALTVTCCTRHVVTPGTKPLPSICTTRHMSEPTSHRALNGSTYSRDAFTAKPQSSPANPPSHTHLPEHSIQVQSSAWCSIQIIRNVTRLTIPVTHKSKADRYTHLIVLK